MPVSPRPSGLPKHIPAWAWKWLKWRTGKKPQPAPKPAPKPVPEPPKPPKPAPTRMFMYDDINVNLIPKNAKAVAGYVDGQWQTIHKILAGWPNAKLLTIAVFPGDNARCLDVEPHDATIAQAPAWVKRQKARGEKLPVLYTSASWGQALVNECTKAGLKYGKDYLWWSAHYDPRKGVHLCGPACGFGLKVTAHATQFTDRANNKSLDESVCSPGFFP